MRTVDKTGRGDWGRGRQIEEAYPVNNESSDEDIEQHFIVPWEMTAVKRKKAEDTKSSEQVAYF